MFFGKLLVSVMITILTYVLAVSLEEFKDLIYSPLTPALVILM